MHYMLGASNREGSLEVCLVIRHEVGNLRASEGAPVSRGVSAQRNSVACTL